MWLITDTLPKAHPEANSCRLHISKKSKKANPAKWICPYPKTISQIISTSDIYIFIADSTGLGLNFSYRNRKKFIASIFQGER